MTGFAQHIAARDRKPAHVFTLPVSAFADEWRKKPREPVEMGLRLIRDADVQTARAEAAKFAWQMHDAAGDDENRWDCFNDALKRWIIARATCQPDDVAVLFFDCAEDTVRVALTSDGVRRIWDEIQQMAIATSPLHREASDDELAALAEMFAAKEPFAHVTATRARPVRRLLAACFDLLTGGED